MIEAYGELVVIQHTPDDEHPSFWLSIERADPVVRASARLVDQIRAGTELLPGCGIDGDLLRIEADDRTVVYRIMEQVPDRFCYVLRWPD